MDELDALLDRAVTIDNAEPEVETPAVLETQVEDTAGEEDVFEEEADASPFEIAAESGEDMELEEDGEPELLAEPDVTPSLAEMQASFREQTLRQQLEEQNRQIRQYQAHQQMLQAQQQLAAMRQQWEQMDPDDAHKAELNFVANQLMTTIRQQQQQIQAVELERAQQAEEERQAAAKPIAIRKAIEFHKLKPSDAALLNVAQTADQLDAIAHQLLASRQQQTQAARKAKARKVMANPALTPTAQGTAAVAAPPKARNLDEFIDGIFA